MTRRLAALSLVVATLPALASCVGPTRRVRASGPDEPAGRPTAEEVAARVKQVVALHNTERADRDLRRLTVSPRLERAARRQAEDMAKTRTMSHKGSDGSSPFDRIEAAGYAYRRAGENVAFGRFTPEALMKRWMDSPPHQRNVLGNFNEIGVACAIAEDGASYWCVTFGTSIRR